MEDYFLGLNSQGDGWMGDITNQSVLYLILWVLRMVGTFDGKVCLRMNLCRVS